jgi:hypothetical protein
VTADQLAQDLVYNAAVKAVTVEATAAAPWLGLPVVSTIFQYVLNWIAGKIYTVLSEWVEFKVIQLKTDAEKQAYDAAVAQLQAAQTSGDPNALEQAKTDFSDAFSKLIHFDR